MDKIILSRYDMAKGWGKKISKQYHVGNVDE